MDKIIFSEAAWYCEYISGCKASNKLAEEADLILRPYGGYVYTGDFSELLNEIQDKLDEVNEKYPRCKYRAQVRYIDIGDYMAFIDIVCYSVGRLKFTRIKN